MFPNFRFHPDRPRTTEPDNSKPNISKLLTGQTLIIKSYYLVFLFLDAFKFTTLGKYYTDNYTDQYITTPRLWLNISEKRR